MEVGQIQMKEKSVWGLEYKNRGGTENMGNETGKPSKGHVLQGFIRHVTILTFFLQEIRVIIYIHSVMWSFIQQLHN